ncbi:uncharacterized protein ACN63O_008804 [Diretmus argenteus]
MDVTPCNVTALEAKTQIDSSIYHLVKLVSQCVSCILNTFLSIPLLLAITRSPSLLRHTRFLLLTHLLCCDNLQVELFLCTALAVDRCVAVKWPLHYDLSMCARRKRATVAAIWTLSALLSSVALCIGLYTMELNASLPRCRPFILAPCLSGTSALIVFCMVGSGVVLPVCYLTILGCFFLLCWDMRGGLLCTKRAGVTLTLQAAQTIFYSVPVILDSYLIPEYLHHDGLDIGVTTIYILGISLIPLAYGYRSRELQQRILQAACGNQSNNQS